jgi:hypothetical protein
MLEYIDTIIMKEKFRNEQEQRLEILISKLVNKGYVAVLVKINPTFCDFLKSKKKAFVGGMKTLFFSCDQTSKLVDFMSLITAVKLWHMSTIRVLIGDANLVSEIESKYSSKPIKISNIADGSWLNEIQNNVNGFLEFSDDDIAIYGDVEIKEIVKDVIAVTA